MRTSLARPILAIALGVGVAVSAIWANPATSDDGDGPARGFGAPGEDPALDSDLDVEKIKAAIKSGVDWLRTQQNADGSFTSSHSGGYPMGPTAMGVLTLLKCGADKNDPAVVKGFEFLRQAWSSGGGGGGSGLGGMLSMRKTYDVALVVLALEARYAPSPELVEKSGKDYETVAREVFRKSPNKQDKRWLEECVKWFVQTQGTRVWRYPGPPGDDQDLSCTQYALLALKAASRMGVRVPTESFQKALDYLLAEQDKSGREVDWFPVPAADGPIREIQSRSKRRSGNSSKRAGKDKKDETVERENPGSGAGETPTMHARGWAYTPRHGGAGGTQPQGSQPQGGQPQGGQPGGGAPGGFPGFPGGGGLPGGLNPFHRTTGSMTAAGIAGLVICKSELETERSFWKRVQGQTDQAIRDGCAWLADNFSVRTNPPGGNHHYYYLYGLERAGVLAGTYDFGKHDWYDEGGKYLLDEQKKDGSWEESLGFGGIKIPGMPAGAGNGDPMSDTCFALLFLKRATVPVVDIPPKRVITGAGKYGGK